MIIMKHPETGGVIRVPERSQAVYERSGWAKDEDATRQLQGMAGADALAAGPVTDKDQARMAAVSAEAKGKDQDAGEAGPRSGSRSKASGTKEEAN